MKGQSQQTELNFFVPRFRCWWINGETDSHVCLCCSPLLICWCPQFVCCGRFLVVQIFATVVLKPPAEKHGFKPLFWPKKKENPMATSEKARNFSCAQKRTQCLWSLQWCFPGWSNLSHASSNRNSKNLRCYCFGVSWSGHSAVLFCVMATLVLPGPLGALIFLLSRLRQTSSISLVVEAVIFFLQHSTLHSLHSPFCCLFLCASCLDKIATRFFFFLQNKCTEREPAAKSLCEKADWKTHKGGETPRICTYFVYV